MPLSKHQTNLMARRLFRIKLALNLGSSDCWLHFAPASNKVADIYPIEDAAHALVPQNSSSLALQPCSWSCAHESIGMTTEM